MARYALYQGLLLSTCVFTLAHLYQWQAHKDVFVIFPVGAGCSKEARSPMVAGRCTGVDQAVSPCLYWLSKGSKPSDGCGRRAGVDMSVSPCLCWLPTGSKSSNGNSGHTGMDEAASSCPCWLTQEVNLPMVVTGMQEWIWLCHLAEAGSLKQ